MAWTWPLIADAAITTDELLPPWAKGTAFVTAVLGGPLFAIWYAWYVTTRVIPDKEKAFAEERAAAEKRHAEHVLMVTRDSREDLKLAWDTNRTNSERFSSILERLMERIDNSCKFNEPRGG